MRIYALLYGRFGERHWWPADSPFEVVVGAVLTQNTAWTNVEKAIANLKGAHMLSPDRLYAAPVSSIARLIRPSGFYNQKAKRLKAVVEYLVTNYRGSMDAMCEKDTPLLRDELLSINGIGRETADSILLYACGKPVFVVDSYTYRVFYRHGLVVEQGGYDEMQQMFMDNLEHEAGLFNEYHALIVELAKRYCRTQPRCDGCPLSGLPTYI
ncbi:MAG: endonuclease III domain-containing protein [Deltaproteobacteria bacterium]|nr:endonuclease III domain-containing protein [Deltaproteobacteria bacterium]MCL5276531.1 endonuclease III domain-containing protein [Deltaproteobacteria bacterium]